MLMINRFDRACSAGYDLQQKLPLIHTYIGMATKNNTTQMTVYLALDPFGVAKT